MRDARAQLFDAAERVLLRDGPSELTSRAVTAEAGCAKGVLHRHFADFGTFLAEFVLDRIARLDEQAAVLRRAAGTGTVVGNLTHPLCDLFQSAAREILGLVTSRHELLARLRPTTPTGIPVLTEATAMFASYLRLERRARPRRPGRRRRRPGGDAGRHRASAVRRAAERATRVGRRREARDRSDRRRGARTPGIAVLPQGLQGSRACNVFEQSFHYGLGTVFERRFNHCRARPAERQDA